MMEEATVWDALPPEEQRVVWHDAERNFWRNFKQEQDAMHAAAEADYQRASTDVRSQLDALSAKRAQLAEMRDRLSRELVRVEEELARSAQACDDRSNKLAAMEYDYRQAELDRMKKREQIAQTMDDFFKDKRGEDPDAEPAPPRQRLPHRRQLPAAPATPSWRDQILNHDDSESLPPPVHGGARVNGHAAAAATAAAALTCVSPPPAKGHAAPACLSPPSKGGHAAPLDVLVNIVDADDNIIGPVRRVESWNQWVKEIQNIPVKRPVRIRRGQRFGRESLATIYDRSEGKGVGWISCMIQATGEVQAQRCHACEKNQGAFDECVVVGGPFFQKCGNCEWNRQGCHMAASKLGSNGGPMPASAASPPAAPAAPSRLLSGDEDAAALAIRRLEAAQEALAKAAGFPRTMTRDLPFAPPTVKTENVHAQKSPVSSEPVQMPTPQEPKEHTFVNAAPAAAAAVAAAAAAASGFKSVNGFTAANGPLPSGGFTPANARGSRPPSRDMLTPTIVSAETSPRPTPPASITDSPPLEDITRENLVLRHNGRFYTYPELVEGVPLEKIDESHPYWELGWKPLRPQVEAQLATWRDKNAVALEARARGEGGSAKFQTGRQVNRGLKILDFLDQGDISPYQLVNKKFIHTGKGAITSYDTLFRMCESLGELAKFNLDVTPVEWMRQRLYEIMIERGPNFNIAKVIHDFYHDKKLTALRVKNGFKSIGRPSGYKPNQNRTPQGSSSSVKKRKGMHSQTGTPRDTPSRATSPLDVEEAAPSPAPTQATTTTTELGSCDAYPSKRVKTLSPPLVPMTAAAAAAAAAAADYSDTDSFSGAPLADNDWRLYQVKTRLFTSNTGVTQYWNWKEHERTFQHQLLKETDPASWGVHREPIDFGVRLDDIVEVRWNIDVLQVHMVMSRFGAAVAKRDGQPRGDVMAAFKRERTIRRFVAFCREKRLRTVEVSPDDMELAWAGMQSERLGGEAGEVVLEE